MTIAVFLYLKSVIEVILENVCQLVLKGCRKSLILILSILTCMHKVLSTVSVQCLLKLHHIFVTARVGAFGEAEITCRENDQSFYSLPDCPAKMERGGSLEEVCG